jgi:hypothetical protein
MTQRYGLVHIVTGGEFAKPLAASQVFDHAEVQATAGGARAPERVAAWAFEPMRRVFDASAKTLVRSLRHRCPNLDVQIVGGIGRLGGWPALRTAARRRRAMFGVRPVVYHCRGEGAARWGAWLRALFPGDALVLDVRGAWPWELLYHRGVPEPGAAAGRDRDDYEKALADVRRVVRSADAVTTVSPAVREWLIEEAGAPAETAVVPCCVKATVGDADRAAARARWGAPAGPVVLYSGTVKSYQHVEDLVLPFMRAVLAADAGAHAVLLTPDIERMRHLVAATRLDAERTTVESLPQSEVAGALTGADIGLLLRAPVAINRFSQPTKFGEYLAAGLPVAVERGTGDLSAILERSGAGTTVVTAGRPADDVAAEAQRTVEWVRREGPGARTAARHLAESEFTWSGVLPEVRDLYAMALARAAQSALPATEAEDGKQDEQNLESTGTGSAHR